MLPELVEFLAEQKGTDEEAKTAGLRQVILDPSLTKQSKNTDTFVFTDAIFEEEEYEMIRSIFSNGNKIGCCENNKDYEVY